MTLVPLNPPPGLDSDDTTFSAAGRWADGNNVRFWEGRPQVIGGWAAKTSAMTEKTRSMFAYIVGGSRTLVLGNASKLYYTQGSTVPTDITPFVDPLGNQGWTFGTFGEYLMASGLGSTLKVWTGSGVASTVSQAPAYIGAGIVTVPQRQVLAFACNQEISGVINNRCIRGCDLEDYTNWTTSPTNNAFEHILDDPGVIVRGMAFGDGVLVFTTASLFSGTFVGNPGQAWAFTREATGCGLAAPFTAAVADGVVYWLTPDLRVMRWTPGALPDPINGPIMTEFRANCSTSLTHSRMIYHRAFREIWLFYPDTRDGGSNENSRYIAFSTEDQGWFRGIMARTAVLDSGGTYVDTTSSPPSTLFMAQASDFKVYAHEHSGGTSPDWYIQSADQYLDEGARRISVEAISLDFKNQTSDVSLTLYTKDRPQSSAVTKGPYTLTSTAKKKNLSVSGMIISAKFSGAANNKNLRFGKLEFDTTLLGKG